MKTIIIADNLVNDYCGIEARYTQRNVNIGIQESERIFGEDARYGGGALPTFLRKEIGRENTNVLFCRDVYSLEEPFHRELLQQFGEHCIRGTSGSEFPAFLKDLTDRASVVECAGLIIPLDTLRNFLKEVSGIDLFSPVRADRSGKLRFLLLGFHTERRIFNTANLLRNLFGFPVAVFSHFLASSNREFHFNALRYQFPDNRIAVLNNVPELAEYLECDLDYLDDFKLRAVHILPEEIRVRLSASQCKIVEAICMHWTEVHLKPLGGGFSGSALFLANGRQGASKTEPMVIKIDEYAPIQMEIKGYNLIKDFLGKHVPTFTFPVSDGGFMGIGMELAAMEGPPSTLQDHYEKAQDDYKLDAFLQLFERTLIMLTNRIYYNTFMRKRLAPFRHFSLHISQQEHWFRTNLENLERHKTDKVLLSEDVLVNIFNIIRKNSDAIFCDLCIGHGDLNLANIIVDDQGNLWTIDWTHTGYHPLSIDFAKMENDIKFVISKEIGEEDLPKLQALEEFLLARLVPAPADELPAHLQFVKWDLRFKKIYRTIRKLRSVYSSLKQDEEWLVYKIALLRYGLHTLSFDKSLDAGECSPTQLWYALISMETLLFQLVADDYHLKIRSERPEFYPERQRLQLDLANWEVPCPDYEPPYFVTPEVLAGDRTKKAAGYADPEDQWDFEDFIDWGRSYSRDADRKPLNPSGRTGIAGRGSLWLWGPNPMVFFLPIRYDKQAQQLEILMRMAQDSSAEPVNVHLRRDESMEEAIERGKSKLVFGPAQLTFTKVHQGYLYDPRQTDNAWIEAKAYLVFLGEEGMVQAGKGSDHLAWKTVSPALINDLYSSYAFLLRKGIQHIYEEGLVREPFVSKILEKTG